MDAFYLGKKYNYGLQGYKDLKLYKIFFITTKLNTFILYQVYAKISVDLKVHAFKSISFFHKKPLSKIMYVFYRNLRIKRFIQMGDTKLCIIYICGTRCTFVGT